MFKERGSGERSPTEVDCDAVAAAIDSDLREDGSWHHQLLERKRTEFAVGAIEAGEPRVGTLISFHRILDLKSATVKRDIIWQSPSGKRIAFKSQRLVSFTEPHLAAISYEVTALDEPATVEISSEMIANESNQVSDGDPRETAPLYGLVLLPQSAHADKTRVFLCHTTRHSQLTLACGMEHQIDTAGQYTTDAHCSKSSAKVVFSVDAQPGQPV